MLAAMTKTVGTIVDTANDVERSAKMPTRVFRGVRARSPTLRRWEGGVNIRAAPRSRHAPR